MAALRISRPGYHTQLVDIGPANGRLTGSWGGSLVVGGPAAPRTPSVSTPADRERWREYKARVRLGTCGKLFRNGSGTCARTSGHADTCASRDALDRMLLRRRGVAFSIHPEKRR